MNEDITSVTKNYISIHLTGIGFSPIIKVTESVMYTSEKNIIGLN